MFTDAVLQGKVTCPNKYVPFLCTLSLCVWFWGILWNVNSTFVLFGPILKTVTVLI